MKLEYKCSVLISFAISYCYQVGITKNSELKKAF